MQANKKGPFNSELGSRVIMSFMNDSIFPTLKEIRKISLEISDYRQTLFGSFYRRELNVLYGKYIAINKKFLNIYSIYETPDDLFKEVKDEMNKNQQTIAMVMADYMQTQGAIKPHLEECFRLLEVMDRTLGRYSQSADQRVSTVLSIAAITISTVVAILVSHG